MGNDVRAGFSRDFPHHPASLALHLYSTRTRTRTLEELYTVLHGLDCTELYFCLTRTVFPTSHMSQTGESNKMLLEIQQVLQNTAQSLGGHVKSLLARFMCPKKAKGVCLQCHCSISVDRDGVFCNPTCKVKYSEEFKRVYRDELSALGKLN